MNENDRSCQIRKYFNITTISYNYLCNKDVTCPGLSFSSAVKHLETQFLKFPVLVHHNFSCII